MKKFVALGFITSCGIAFASYGVAQAFKDTCGYDPKTGYHYDSKYGWSSNGGWKEAIACAKEGKLPDNVAEGLGVWGDKKTQAEGRKWAKINAEVKKAREEAERKAKEDARKKESASKESTEEKKSSTGK